MTPGSNCEDFTKCGVVALSDAAPSGRYLNSERECLTVSEKMKRRPRLIYIIFDIATLLGP